jgi:glutaredoxin
MTATLTLYARPGCHLCAEARERLLEIRREGVSFELREVDIEADDRLHRELLERVPVIEVDGARVSELVPDYDAIVARLATVGA